MKTPRVNERPRSLQPPLCQTLVDAMFCRCSIGRHAARRTMQHLRSLRARALDRAMCLDPRRTTRQRFEQRLQLGHGCFDSLARIGRVLFGDPAHCPPECANRTSRRPLHACSRGNLAASFAQCCFRHLGRIQRTQIPALLEVMTQITCRSTCKSCTAVAFFCR